MIPTISFVGRSNVGKTTHLEKVIRELKSRGHRIATIKHDVHGFDIDIPGKDTWRHAHAGADAVIISSPAKYACIEKVDQEKTLDEIIEELSGFDLVITEGYKKESKPKVEIVRKERSEVPLCTEEDLLALVTDCDIAMKVPIFSFDEVTELVDLIEQRYIANKGELI